MTDNPEEPRPATDTASVDPDYNEAAYLAAFPKVIDNIRAGHLKSGYDHYLRKGVAEGRLQNPRYRRALAEQALLARLSGPPIAEPPSTPPHAATPATARPPAPAEPPQAAAPGRYIASGLDTLLVTQGGLCVAIGWVDDRGIPLHAIILHLPSGRTVTTTAIARCRRSDAEAAIGCPPGHLLGFYAVIDLAQAEPAGAGTTIQLLCGEDSVAHPTRPHLLTPATLRDNVFEYLAAATYFGAPPVESFLQMQSGIGQALLTLNAAISASITALAHVERHGQHARRFIATIVVCLYGKPEFLFLQAALFSAAPAAADYEYLYVSNSPELAEQLQREARLAAQVYGLAITLVFLPGNAGFGAANNAAVSHAASSRILILNPDVFPRSPDWATQHAQLIDALPAEQTRLFGAPLFYDDGALMHAGMFFEVDTGLSVRPTGVIRQELLRVEHYGKGAPPDFPAFRRPRPVPAVTGAFIATDRAWFERIGGFSEAYVFGHYEDADLCMKCWQQGGQVWLHDIAFWHLEGKGSTRMPAHEGGSMINRWHFTRTWLPTIQDGLLGHAPARLAA